MVTVLVDQSHVLVATNPSETVLIERNPEHEAALQLRQIVMASQVPMRVSNGRGLPFWRQRDRTPCYSGK